ncbi:MAG: iron uptake porin [Leptolyngbya sp. BL-A-14]
MVAKTVLNALVLVPGFVGAISLAAVAGIPGEQTANEAGAAMDTPTAKLLSDYSAENFGTNTAAQVTSVSQLSDVKPTDWAFQALQSLVERYGCIVGYPDKTYRGNRALSRYEFAAGLNACMDRINELIAAGTADLVKKEDLLAVQKLQEEFAAELATLRGRVDALEARTATLEKQQFSTTTKLRGEVIFSLSDTFGDRAVRSGNGTRLTNTDRSPVTRDNKTNPIFADRVRLALDTSFTGKDLLRTRLQARNITPYSGNLTGTNETRLGFDGNESNSVLIDKIFYRFPLGNNFRVQIDAANIEFYDSLLSTLSPFESSGAGAVSRFGRFSPIYRVNNPQLNGTGLSGAAGITAAYKFNEALRLEGGFSGSSASNNPVDSAGLFNGDYAAIGQVVFTPNKAITLGLTYAHSYYGPGTLIGDAANGNRANLTASLGTAYASNPFGNSATNRVGFTADSVGGAVQLRLSPALIVGGWAGAAFAHRNRSNDDATILYAAAYLGFPDLGSKGSLGGLLVGITPHVIDNNGITANRQDGDTPFHVEAFYRYRLTENIAITPGLFVLFNPEGNSTNATQYVGVIRTTFTF